ILFEEQRRVGVKLDLPSDWMISREEREYALADRILVLSTFAMESFFARQALEHQIVLHPLGVDIAQFEAGLDKRRAREARILSGAPLRILTVGTFSFQKGARTLVDVARVLGRNGAFKFRFVGDRPFETASLKQEAGDSIDFIDRVPERE